MTSENTVTTKQNTSGGNKLLGFIVFLLLLSNGYMYYRVDSMQNLLDYAVALAENADQHAHSHTRSDIRLKKDIAPLSNQLESVMQLRPVQYEWDHDVAPILQLGEQPEMGLIAQEVELLYPDVVSTDKDGYKTLDYEQLIPVLIQAIQEQQAEIDRLEAQINE